MSKNRVINGFEDAFESGQAAVSTAAKQAAKDFTASAKGQITGSPTTSLPQSLKTSQVSGDNGTNEQSSASQNSHLSTDPKTDEERKQFLRDLYGGGASAEKSSNLHADSSKTELVKQALGLSSDPNVGKTPEEIAKLAALRNQLHSKYYQELTTPKQKEVSVTEKLEREEQMEQMDAFEKQKEKPNPLQNVKQGTGESVVGVSG